MRTSGIHRWLHDHPTTVDAAAAALAFVFFALVMGATFASGSPGLHLLAAGLVIGPYATRRLAPFASAMVTATGAAVQLAFLWPVAPSDVMVLPMVATVAAHCRQRWQRTVTQVVAVVMALWFAREAGMVFGGGWGFSAGDALMAFAGTCVALACAWVLGDATRFRLSLMERLEEQNAALARDRDQRGIIAAQNERTSIAREMHDIVAHALAVVVVQADGGAYTSRQALERRGDDPELLRATETLETVAEHARSALAETRRLVGVLRDGEAGAEYAPLGGIGDVEDLVATTRAAGREVELGRVWDTAHVPAQVGAAAYRVVQESLTNVLKHAGPDARTTVLVDAGGTDLRIAVVDDGAGAAPDAVQRTLGHGILGMTERVEVLGGTLRARPRPEGGFEVSATIPLPERAETQPVPMLTEPLDPHTLPTQAAPTHPRQESR